MLMELKQIELIARYVKMIVFLVQLEKDAIIVKTKLDLDVENVHLKKKLKE